MMQPGVRIPDLRPSAGLGGGCEDPLGTRILDEVQGSGGVLLWFVLRDLTLWLRRGGKAEELFGAGAAERRGTLLRELLGEEELHQVLRPICGALAGAEEVTRGQLRDGCVRVAQWADGRMLCRTAYAYLHLSTLADPDSADAALRVAIMARRLDCCSNSRRMKTGCSGEISSNCFRR